MRWPLEWTIRGLRRRSGAPGEAGATAPDAASSAAADRPTGAWAEVPALLPVIPPAPLTAPAREFVGELAGSRSPDPILRPLEHETAGDGPVGTVVGRARPIVASGQLTRATPDLPRPARAGLDQRRRGAAAGRAADGGPTDDARAMGAEDAGSAVAGAGSVALPRAGESRRLAPVPASARETGRRLTTVEPGSVASLADRDPAVARDDVGRRTSSTGDPRDRAAASMAPSPRTAAPRPSAGPDTDRSRPGPVADRPGARRPGPDLRPSRPGQARIVRRTIAGGPQARRTRLGAPIDGPLPLAAPPGDVVGPGTGDQAVVPARVAPPAPARGGNALPLPILRRPGAAGRSDAAGHPGIGDAPGSPGVPSAGPPRSAGSRGPRAGDGRSATEGPAARRTGSTRTPGRRTAPILARRPLRPPGPRSTVPRPRLVPPPDDIDPRRRDVRPTGPGQWAPTTSGPIDGRPSDEVSTEPGASVGPLTARSAESTREFPTPMAADTPVGVAGGRASSVPPAWHPRSGPMPDAPVSPAVAGPDVEGPWSVTRSPTAVRASRPSAAYRAVGSPHAAETDGSPGGEEAAGSAPATEGPGSAASGGEPGEGASAAGSGIASTSEADLDVLARRLYGRFRERLAGELLLDRERAGLLADR